MPIIRSAKKAHRASLKKKIFNTRRKVVMRSAIKKLKELVAEKETKKATEILPMVYKAIDKAAKRGVIKKNTAARKKSRLTKLIAR